jgi:hypothetical protein
MTRLVEGSRAQLMSAQQMVRDAQYIFVMVDAQSMNDAMETFQDVKTWCEQNLDEGSWAPTSYSFSLKSIEAATMFRLRWT